MAAPELDVPIYEYLARLDPNRFLPGVGEIPEDAITLLETNPRFIESVMVGLNSEMESELCQKLVDFFQRPPIEALGLQLGQRFGGQISESFNAQIP